MKQVLYQAQIMNKETEEVTNREGIIPYYGPLEDTLEVRKYLRTSFERELPSHQELGGFWTITLTEDYKLECEQCQQMYDIRGKEEMIVADLGYCSKKCWDEWCNSEW